MTGADELEPEGEDLDADLDDDVTADDGTGGGGGGGDDDESEDEIMADSSDGDEIDRLGPQFQLHNFVQPSVERVRAMGEAKWGRDFTVAIQSALADCETAPHPCTRRRSGRDGTSSGAAAVWCVPPAREAL